MNGTEQRNLTGPPSKVLTTREEVYIALHTIAAFFSLTGNCLVGVVFIRNNGGRVRNTNNALLINLSAAVILYTCNNYTMTIHSIVRGQMRWELKGLIGEITCRLELVLMYALFLSCHLSVLTIAIERFLIVCFPLSWIVTSTLIKAMIASTWLGSLLLYSPFLYLGNVRHVYGMTRCFVRFVPDITTPFFKVELAVLLAVIVALLLIYLVILCRLYTRNVPGQPLHAQRRMSNRVNRKVTQRVALILVLFYSCWLPFNLLNAFHFADKLEIVMHPAYSFSVEFLPFLYGALCPWIFPLLHEDFRQGMMVLLCCNRRRRRTSVCQMQMSRSHVSNSVAVPNGQRFTEAGI
ncbi:predicted protein [Nematostella vectensis]|uniref:G-protein coupled receptors family 1 profile domain-containing protein n=1 Tax=Nematostella vectensis TaxID=45351 RepID=A7RZT0_NEMVE|nr:predicted protein [Nematostella vectensis]|eukprot:XP_001635063.1 predicted protein [Nematostella vectensis]